MHESRKKAEQSIDTQARPTMAADDAFSFREMLYSLDILQSRYALVSSLRVCMLATSVITSINPFFIQFIIVTQ